MKRAIFSITVLLITLIFTGYIQDKDLPALYSGAEWFIFTSAYEGFGLPILEAREVTKLGINIGIVLST